MPGLRSAEGSLRQNRRLKKANLNRETIINQPVKGIVHKLLRESDFGEALKQIRALPPKKTINALLPKLLSLDHEEKWRAVSAAGVAVCDLAAYDLEAARIIIRRMIWNLTEESGTCGWGAAELMAETLANHRGLAEEFSNILISFIVPEGNYLEFEPLQRGAVWGIGRLAESYPDLAGDSPPYLCALLKSNDAHIRGLACHALMCMSSVPCLDLLGDLTKDTAEITLFARRKLQTVKVGDLAREALAIPGAGSPS